MVATLGTDNTVVSVVVDKITFDTEKIRSIMGVKSILNIIVHLIIQPLSSISTKGINPKVIVVYTVANNITIDFNFVIDTRCHTSYLPSQAVTFGSIIT